MASCCSVAAGTASRTCGRPGRWPVSGSRPCGRDPWRPCSGSSRAARSPRARPRTLASRRADAPTRRAPAPTVRSARSVSCAPLPRRRRMRRMPPMSVCASLREPVATLGAEFHLTPYAGVAVLGQDASAPKLLLDHARAAATEARRCGSSAVCFFTDTLRLRSLARLDIARELRDAIANRDIRLRYVGRHDLESGRLVTWVGYLRWLHPLRGEIRAAEFLKVAETTGLATTLSRAVLGGLGEDFARLSAAADADVRLSFGALRHHVLHEDFAADIGRILSDGAVPAERLELRVSERALIARDAVDLRCLGQLGVQLVVDEVGRGMGSLDLLARAPIWGLQLDRAWVTALRSDAVARKVCHAGIGMATALGVTPIATGVDDPEQREALLALGCRLGSGDLFRDAVADLATPRRAAARA